MSAVGQRIGVYGASGSGKSTWVRAEIATRQRVVIFDALEEYAGRRGVLTARGPKGLSQNLRRAWPRDRFVIAYVPTAGDEPAELHRLATVLRLAQSNRREGGEFRGRRLTLYVEEMNTAFPIADLPAGLRGMMDLCSRGRHYGIDLIGVSQRPSEIHNRFRGNCTAVVAFRPATVRDVTVLSDLYGAEHREALRTLVPHEFLRLDAGGAVSRGRNPPQK